MQGAGSNGTADGAFSVRSRGFHGAGKSLESKYINSIGFDLSLVVPERSQVQPETMSILLWIRVI